MNNSVLDIWKRYRAWMLGLLTFVISLLLAAICSAQEIKGPNIPVPPSYFGMHFHKADQGTAWPGHEIGTWRLWDAGVAWIDLQPAKDRWEFSKLDRYVEMASMTNTQVLYPFGLTPTWASARPQEKGTYRPGDKSEPQNTSDWETFVATMVNRYRGRIRHYELWNEVNTKATGFFSGKPEALLSLQKSAYNVIKRIDPDVVFVSPSSIGEADWQLKWFEDYLALGGGKYADVISYHFYQPRKSPEAIFSLVSKVRAIMEKYGVGNKPIWNTESGYRMELGQLRTDPAYDTWPALSPERAAAYVSRALILGWVAGLERFYWYAWDNGVFGFIDTQGQITQAAAAYRTTARWMIGAQITGCEVSKSIWVCTLQRPERRAWLAWREDNTPATWVVGRQFDVKAVQSLSGVTTALSADRTVILDGQPKLLSDAQVIGDAGLPAE